MSAEIISDAIVIGAGPVGMTAASELSRYGLKVRIFDKRADIVTHSHAITVQVRTQEVLAAMGIAQSWHELGFPFEEMSVHAYDKHLGTVRLWGVEGDPHKGPLNIGQNITEKLLVEHLIQQNVTIERPIEVIAVNETSERVTITLKHPDGRAEQASAKYLLGCEGSNSLVRKTANIAFEGELNSGIEFLQTDAVVRCAYPPGRGNLFITADRLIGMFPLDGNGLFRVLCARPDLNPEDKSAPTLTEMEQIVREIVDAEASLSAPQWLNRFRTQHRVAASFRAGSRSFIVGDAAHVHVPLAGQGMNTGIQDAFNLSWKLAYVIKGWAAESILDSYDEERRPNAENLIKFTDTGFRTVVKPEPLAGTVIALFGSTILNQKFVREGFRSKIAEIDINYRKSSLSQQLGTNAGPQAGDRFPDVRLVRASDRVSMRLHEALIGQHWSLFVFGGDDATLPGKMAGLFEIDDKRVQSFFVTRDRARGTETLWQQHVLLDPDGEAHEKLAANKPCLIVVRPDWYIGFRTHFASYDQLTTYFSRVLKDPVVVLPSV